MRKILYAFNSKKAALLYFRAVRKSTPEIPGVKFNADSQCTIDTNANIVCFYRSHKSSDCMKEIWDQIMCPVSPNFDPGKFKVKGVDDVPS